ncbi:hypothetical protein Ddye_000225 [Dipteronia dyeriana]|uniref:Cytochrome P450 n=1 Tax=Dipteronia dyeriana TaxID=168575 RepID=A0AAD9XL94_9ROSI|nr:hypothetical protein Ddye_000225 [Dipteronia dyeriana]
MEKVEAEEEVNVGGELLRLTNNIITRMTLGQRCSDNEDESGEVRKLVKELNQLGSKFIVSETIWFCKNLDLLGFRKKLKDARDKYDVMMERIMKENELARNKKNYKDETADDLLDILLDIYEDENAEIRLTRENIKAFIMTRFFVNLWSLGRDSDHWENPHEFRPERFLSEKWSVKSQLSDVRGQCFHMIPFRSGRRSCHGATLVLQFVPTTLAAIIKCFELKVGNGASEMSVGMEVIVAVLVADGARVGALEVTHKLDIPSLIEYKMMVVVENT